MRLTTGRTWLGTRKGELADGKAIRTDRDYGPAISSPPARSYFDDTEVSRRSTSPPGAPT
jgi:hypothetical protein